MRSLFCLALMTLTAHTVWGQTPSALPAPAPAPAQSLERGKAIERTLGVNETQAYTVTLAAGEYFQGVAVQRGVDVTVRVFAPDGGKIAERDSPNGDQGDEPIAFETKTTGAYRIEVIFNADPLNKAGRYDIKILSILSPKENAERIAENRRKEQVVHDWLKANVVPLKTVEAGNGFDGLQPFKKVFKNVRFVGLGEATHGTHEFFQFKHRMLEFLVREMGFRVFAIEGSYAALQNINDYVQGKTTDGTAALDSQGFWTWNTTEIRAMMDWARAYNRGVAPDKRVEFVGFDIQFNQSGKDKLMAYLKRVAPERVAPTEAFFAQNLDALNTFGGTPDESKAAGEKLKALQISYNDLYVFLDLNGLRLASRSSQAEYEQMREYARVLTQYVSSYTNRGMDGALLRDVFMADNLRRIAERHPADTRFVVWAHDGHITTSDNGGTYPTFGYHLRRFYGNQYYALGFAFNQGGFQARALQEKPTGPLLLTGFTVAPAPPNSIEWYLAQTGAKTLFVDFRIPSKNAAVDEWLAAPHPMRLIESVFAPTREAFYTPISLRGSYDGLFFIDTTTRAHPNPSVKNVAP